MLLHDGSLVLMFSLARPLRAAVPSSAPTTRYGEKSLMKREVNDAFRTFHVRKKVRAAAHKLQAARYAGRGRETRDE